MAADEPNWTLTPQAIVGLLIVIAGLVLTAGNLGWIEPRPILAFWPLGIVAIGWAMLLRATDRQSRSSALVVLLIGGWIATARLVFDVSPFSFALLWSIGLVGLGLTIVMRAWGGTSPEATSEQRLSDFAFWSGVQRRVTTPVFRRADLTAVMGGIEMDLRGAGTAGEAIIDVFVVWGGVEIRVPPDWSVSNQVVAIMAGASDKSTGTRDSRNRLLLRGFVLMGGVEIKT